MIRHVVAVAITLLVNTAPVFGQNAPAPVAELVVNVTADLHKSPTTASEIIGKAPRGTALPINRNLGSWFEVPWPESAGGIAFVHVNTGKIMPRSTTSAPSGAQAAIAQIGAVAAAATAANRYENVNADRVMATNRVAARPAGYVSLPQHQIGIGALLNTSTLRFGGSARTWMGRRLGVEFSVSRPELESADGQLIPSTQLAPSVLYSLPEAVTDTMWVRPFVGAGPRFYRANLEKRMGYEAFGGVEATMAAMPQFALSGEMGYRWSRPWLGDFRPRQIASSVSGHWYVK